MQRLGDLEILNQLYDVLQIVALLARNSEFITLNRGLHLELGGLYSLNDLLRQIALDTLPNLLPPRLRVQLRLLRFTLR